MTATIPSARLARIRPDRSHNFGQVFELKPEHEAVRTKRTLFPSTVVSADDSPRLLVSGHNNLKVGRRVERGAWAGLPIFTLTLEERASCPITCHHWRGCMGNNMPFARRHRHGPELEAALDRELRRLTYENPKGIVVRLHILGDFYSTAYVRQWGLWLDAMPYLRIFGYTARPRRSEIGQMIDMLNLYFKSRCKIRFSVPTSEVGEDEAIPCPLPAPLPAEYEGAIVCPAQRSKTETCGTCALCWSTDRNIAFALHGRSTARA